MKLFILDLSILQKGDIVLTSEKSLVSNAVRKATKSHYSHAMLCVDHGSLIHSDKLGVHSKNPQRLFFKEEGEVKVLRVIDSSYVEEACKFTRSQVGIQYDLKGAIQVKNPLRQKEASNKQFCSRLVAQAYEHAGLRLVSDTAFCTPQELDDSEQTYTITNALRPLTERDREFANTKDPIKEQTRITNKILNEIRTLTGDKSIQSMVDVTEFLQESPQFDTQISAIYRSSGYLDQWRHERKTNAWRYDGELFMQLEMSTEKLAQVAQQEILQGVQRLEHCKENMKQAFFLKETSQLQFASMLFDLYKNLVGETFDNIYAAEYVLNTLGASMPIDIESLKKA